MKKIRIMFFQIICFFLVLILLLNYLSNVLTAKTLYEYPSRNQYWQTLNAEDKNTIDIVFTGDSTLTNAVIPVHIRERTGVTSYLDGFAVMKPRESYFDLKRIFKEQSPKYVFVEASYLVKITSGEDKYLTGKVKNFVSFIEEEITGFIDYYFPVMRYKSAKDDLTFEDFITVHPDKINSVYKGYLYAKRKKPFNPDELKFKEGSVVYADNGDRYFAKMYNLCKKNNCKIILVALPQIKKWNYAYHKKIAGLAQKYNVSFIDYHINADKYIEGFSWETDSKDGGSHLNYSGASKTTKAISEYIVGNLHMSASNLTAEQVAKWDKDTLLFYETTGQKPVIKDDSENQKQVDEHEANHKEENEHNKDKN